MRDIFLALLFAVLVVATVIVRRLPVVVAPVGLWQYVGVQAIYIAATIAVLRFPEWSERHPQFFYSSLVVSLGLALRLAIGYNGAHPHPLRVIPVSLGIVLVAGATAVTLYYITVAYSFSVPTLACLPLVIASAFTFCGMLALCSMAAPLSRVEIIVRSCLAAAWLFHGVYGFAVAIGFIRARSFWIEVNDILPTTISIVAFGLLAIGLYGHQQELSRDADRIHAAIVEAHDNWQPVLQRGAR